MELKHRCYASQATAGLSFNRTSMELKRCQLNHFAAVKETLLIEPSMELKLGMLHRQCVAGLLQLLIEPVWN